MLNEIEAPKPKFTLRKLPMWGQQVTLDKIDFEWPTQEMLDRWLPDVSLKSITFSTYDQNGAEVSSVQCMLSNNESSPLFDISGRSQFHKKTINFDANRPVKSVQAID